MFIQKNRHNRGPTQQSYYCGPGLLMDYHLEKTVGVQCFDGVLIRQLIFWKVKHRKDFQNNGTKPRHRKKTKAIRKGKEKRTSEDFDLRKLDTIEDQQNNHTIGEQGCS